MTVYVYCVFIIKIYEFIALWNTNDILVLDC